MTNIYVNYLLRTATMQRLHWLGEKIQKKSGGTQLDTTGNKQKSREKKRTVKM